MNSFCSVTNCDDISTKKTFCSELLKLRAKESLKNDSGLLCEKHHKHYIVFYSKRHKYCCNPYGSHGSSNKGVEINTYYAKENKKYDLIPGKKLCQPCRARIKAGELTTLEVSVEIESSAENVLDVSYTEVAPANEAHDLNLHSFNSAIGKILSYIVKLTNTLITEKKTYCNSIS
jgi:hypothetical protein